MEKLELTDENIKSLGIDPTLSNEIIWQKLFEIENSLFDSEKNVIYIDVLDAYDDPEYLLALVDCNIPQLYQLEEKLSHITNEKLKNSLFRKGVIKILEANLEAENVVMEKILFEKQTEPIAIDLSDTKAIDKILYLHKIGVIDFLRGQQPFNTSVNSLASVLSAITGEKSGTLQPMLNPMLSKKVDDTNNPLNSKKAVERVEKQLINIGFNLNETN